MVFCDFVARWPIVEQAKRARKATLASFFHDHNVRRADCIEARIESIKTTRPLTKDSGVITPAKLTVEALIPQLKALRTAIETYDKEIEKVSSRLTDLKIFRSFPSAAAVYAPRLLAAFGEDRDRFQSTAEVQRYGGVAPVTERNGKQSWVHWRFKSTKFLRQTLSSGRRSPSPAPGLN